MIFKVRNAFTERRTHRSVKQIKSCCVLQFLRDQIAPIFQMSVNNMEEDEIRSITLSLARIAYQAEREGTNIMDLIRTTVLPLEATKPYDIVAGTKGHLVDKEANREAVKKFLYSED